MNTLTGATIIPFPMKESVDYAHGIPPGTREAKLGMATLILSKVSHMISVFLNTVCNIARPNDERFIDNNGDMEGDTSIFHVWFCTDTGIDDDVSSYMDVDEFTEEAINWLKLVYERLQNSMKLAWTTYGARPKMTSTSNSNQTYTSTDRARQVIEEEKVDARTGVQERHADWLQKVNMEQKNWDQSDKTQVVKEEPSKNLIYVMQPAH